MKPTAAHCDGDDGSACGFASSSLDDAFSFVNALDFQSETAHKQIQSSANTNIPPAASAPSRSQQTEESSERRTQQQQGTSCRRRRTRPPTAATGRPTQNQTRVSTHCVKSAVRSSTTRCQQQQQPREPPHRDEISRLRDQVRQVQQQQHTDATTATHTDAAKWLLQAAIQYQELQQTQTEAANDNLRVTLANQIELQQCLKTQLQELAALESVCQSQAERRRQSSHIKIEPRVTCGSPWIRTEQLHKSMAALYRDTDAAVRQVLTAATDMASIFSSSQSRRDPVRGPLFELKTSAPVPASSQVLSEVLWRLLADCESKCESVDEDMAEGGPNPCLGSGSDQEDSHEKWYSLDLHTHFGDVQVHGASVLRRFEEHEPQSQQQQQRLVVTFASSIAASESSELVFRESGWFILTQQSEAAATSLFQTFYRLQLLNHPVSADSSKSSSHKGCAPMMDSDTAYLQDLVMNALSNRTRAHHQQLQNSLLAHSRAQNVKVKAPAGYLALVA
ncbi:hypothetical protein Gpo141_00003708 [Globisporangium polare]